MSRADRRTVVAVVAALVVAFLLPTFLGSYWLFLATSAVITALLALSVGVVTGHAGMISLCQLSFAAVGAWVVVDFAARSSSVPIVLQLLAGSVVAAVLGALIGLPALRLRGINLAVVTLGAAVALNTVLTVRDFPGADAFASVSRPAQFTGDREFFWLCCCGFALAAGLVFWADRRRLGASWLAVRHSERSAAAVGLNVPRVKLTAFAASAAIAGLAGGLTATQLGIVTARNFDPVQGLALFALAIFVGARWPAGALLAGVLAAGIPELLRRLGLSQDLGDVLFAAGAVQALSKGSSVMDGLRAGRRGKRVRPSGAPAAPSVPTPTIPARAARSVARRSDGGGAELELRGLTLRYGEVTALDGVDLHVPGGVAAVVGPNGAGKSTLIDVVAGFLRADGGSVLLDGQPVDGLPAHARARAGLRRTFQTERTPPDLTVAGYIRLASGRRLDRTELDELADVLVLGATDRPIATVDVGTRRLVELAGALASRPRLLLLDEPAAGLGPLESTRLGRQIAEIPLRFGTTVVLVEHDMELVRAASSQVTVLDFGRVVLTGSPEVVLADSRVEAAYLGGGVLA